MQCIAIANRPRSRWTDEIFTKMMLASGRKGRQTRCDLDQRKEYLQGLLSNNWSTLTSLLSEVLSGVDLHVELLLNKVVSSPESD